MEAIDVMLWIAVIAAVIIGLYMIGGLIMGYPIFGCGGSNNNQSPNTANMTDASQIEQQILSQQRIQEQKAEQEIQNTFEALDLLSVGLRTAANFFSVQKYLPVEQLQQDFNNYHQFVNSRPTNVSSVIEQKINQFEGALCYNADNNSPMLQGTPPANFDMATMLNQLLCAINAEKKNLLSLGNYKYNGKPMLSQEQKNAMLARSTDAFLLSGDVDGLAPAVRNALIDNLSLTSDDDKLIEEASYADNLYHHINKSNNMERRHQEAVKERKKNICTNSVGKTRIIEEEVFRTDAVGYPRVRTCSQGGMGATVTPDAPNTAALYGQQIGGVSGPAIKICHWAKGAGGQCAM